MMNLIGPVLGVELLVAGDAAVERVLPRRWTLEDAGGVVPVFDDAGGRKGVKNDTFVRRKKSKQQQIQPLINKPTL